MSRRVLAMHGRDHCPGGADPIPCFTTPCFRAWQRNHNDTITNNNVGEIGFDRWQTEDENAFTNGSIVAGSPDFIRAVNFQQPGLYLIHLYVAFTPWGTGDFGLSLEDLNTNYTGPPQVVMPATVKAGYASTGSWSWTTAMSFPPIWREDTTVDLAPTLPEMTFTFFNRTGSTITTDTARTMVEIHRLKVFDYSAIPVSFQA